MNRKIRPENSGFRRQLTAAQNACFASGRVVLWLKLIVTKADKDLTDQTDILVMRNSWSCETNSSMCFIDYFSLWWKKPVVRLQPVL